MSASKVYLCPSCQSVIRSDRDVSEGLKCDSCGSSFGGSGSGTAAPKRPRSESSASPSILRDVMKNREGIVLPVSFGSTEKLGNFKSEKLAAAAEGSRDEESILSDGSRQVKRRKKRRKEEKHKKLYIFITASSTIQQQVLLLQQQQIQLTMLELLEQMQQHKDKIITLMQLMVAEQHLATVHY